MEPATTTRHFLSQCIDFVGRAEDYGARHHHKALPQSMHRLRRKWFPLEGTEIRIRRLGKATQAIRHGHVKSNRCANPQERAWLRMLARMRRRPLASRTCSCSLRVRRPLQWQQYPRLQLVDWLRTQQQTSHFHDRGQRRKGKGQRARGQGARWQEVGRGSGEAVEVHGGGCGGG